jgi:hypothetical protein
METHSSSGGKFFAISGGIFLFIFGAVALYRGQVMLDPTDSPSYEIKYVVGFRARLIGILAIIFGILMVGFGIFAA